MKKLIFTLCALCLCGTMWAVTSDNRYYYDTNRPEASEIYVDATTQLYFFVNSSGDATLTYINDADATDNAYVNSNWTSGYTINGTLTIPETVQAEGGEVYNVTAIGWYAFYKADITGSITIPEYITELGYSAFEGNTGITEVTLDYNSTALNEVNNQAYGNSFYGCSGIKTVNLNREVNPSRGYSNSSNWGYLISPFSYLTSIETIYVGAEVKEIMYNMFYCNSSANCSLKDVYCYATDHIPTLEYQAFGLHTDLTLHVYDELVTNFQNDSQTYSWPSFFSTIEGMGSVGLEEGTYKDVATGLYFELDEDGNASIYHDEAGIYTDENLVIYSVDEEGKANAYTLPEEVEDENGVSGKVNRIEAEAFSGADIQGHLVIPAHIIYMGTNAFLNCTSLTEVTYEYGETPMKEENQGNMTGGSFQGCSGVTTVNLYRDIELTGSASNQTAAFVGTTSVATINIGPRVSEIPQYMFRNTTYRASGGGPIKTINSYAANPPTLTNSPFARMSDNTLNVPQGSKDLYSSASVWTDQINSDATGNDYGICTLNEMTNVYAVNIHNVDADNQGYATFYDSKAVKLYGDVVAYTVSGVEVDEETNNAYVLMQELGDVIPAGTGALLAGDVAYYTAIEETAVSSETYSGTDYLLGFDEDGQTTVAPNGGDEDEYYFYMLTLDSANDEGSLAFYWGAAEGAPFTCSAHKAYLALEKEVVGTNNVKLKKDGNGGDETTGISSVESATEGATVKGIYTVQGVRVSNMNQPGLYIVDGKKVLVK